MTFGGQCVCVGGGGGSVLGLRAAKGLSRINLTRQPDLVIIF